MFILFIFPLVGFKRNLSLLDIYVLFFRVLIKWKQLVRQTEMSCVSWGVGHRLRCDANKRCPRSDRYLSSMKDKGIVNPVWWTRGGRWAMVGPLFLKCWENLCWKPGNETNAPFSMFGLCSRKKATYTSNTGVSQYAHLSSGGLVPFLLILFPSDEQNHPKKLIANIMLQLKGSITFFPAANRSWATGHSKPGCALPLMPHLGLNQEMAKQPLTRVGVSLFTRVAEQLRYAPMLICHLCARTAPLEW